MSTINEPASDPSHAGARGDAASLYARYRESPLTTPLEATAFWLAVVLPFLHVPLLLTGLDGPETTAFLLLVGLNVVALVAGHGHCREAT